MRKQSAEIKEALYQDVEKTLHAYIRAHKMRRTIERDTVVKQICQYSCTFSAEQLIADLNGSIRVSVATIYNTLDLLQACHLLMKIEPHIGSTHAEYELVDPKAHKSHIVCTQCGRVAEFKDKVIEDILRGKKFSNFQMENYSLRVYGTCKKCRRKGNTLE